MEKVIITTDSAGNEYIQVVDCPFCELTSGGEHSSGCPNYKK